MAFGARDIKLARLFVEFESNAKGFQKDVEQNQKALGRLTDFIKANPLAALGALGAAAVAAGVKAGQMAAQFDASARKIAASIPSAINRLDDLKKTADSLATSKGLSSDQVLGGLSAIAKEGVPTLEALTVRFNALQKASDATGESVESLAAPFDQILDVFQLSDQQLEHVVATLFKLSRDKGIGFADLLGVFQSAAPTIRDAGLSFDQGAAALSRFLAEGLNAKQAAKELKEDFKNLGAQGLKGLTGDVINASDALHELDRSAKLVADSQERLLQMSSARAEAGFRRFGDLVNKYAIRPLGNLLALWLDPRGPWNAAAAKSLEDTVAAAVEASRNLPNGGAGHTQGGRFRRTEPGTTAPTEDQKKRAQAFFDEVHEATVKATDTLVDDLGLVLEKFKEKFQANIALATAEQRKEAEDQLAKLEGQIALLRRAEAGIKGITPQLQQTTQGGKLPIRKDAEGLADAAKDAADQAERYKQEQDEADRRIQQARDHVRQQADAIERAARNAVILGEAFGLLDENVGKALEGIVQVGSELQVIAKNGLNFDSVLSIGAGIASIVSGLFAESPRDRAERESRDANTQAIHELTKAFTSQVSGADVGQARSAVDALLGRGTLKRKGDPDFADVLDIKKVQQTLAQFGLSFADLQDLLKEINPNLKLNTTSASGFVDSLKQIREALAEINFRAFADSFAGQLQLLQDQFDLMDVTKPLEQLQALAKFAAGQSPVVKDLLTGIDLSTAAGRQEAEKRLLDVFKRLGLDTASGGFTAAELGNLSSQDLLDLIKQIESLIDQTNEQSGQQTGGESQTTFGAISGITEATGNRLAGILSSADTHLASIDSSVLDIRNFLAPLVPVNPPSLPVGIGQPAGPIVFEVNVYGAPDQGTARAIGQTVGATAAETFDRALGARARKRSIQSGKAVVNG